MIFHTDQGVEYRAWLIQDTLKEYGVLSSMNRAESVADNAHMESFFRSMKTESIKGITFKTEAELRTVLSNYVDGFYNSKDCTQDWGTKRLLSVTEWQHEYWQCLLFRGKFPH